MCTTPIRPVFRPRDAIAKGVAALQCLPRDVKASVEYRIEEHDIKVRYNFDEKIRSDVDPS